MRPSGFIILIVTFLAIGVFALPKTVSLFTGMHSWYDLEANASDVPCEKCHADIFEELDLSSVHKGWGIL